jgi:hypothetical protein
VIGINQVTESSITGWTAGYGQVIVAAGPCKLCRGRPGFDDVIAIRRVLGVPLLQWRLSGLAAGGAGWVMGAAVSSGGYPLLGSVGLAAFWAVFCTLLAHVFVNQAPGSWGHISSRKATGATAGALTWRAMARSGIAGTAVRRHLRPVCARANGETP